jgi:hypothetical protein
MTNNNIHSTVNFNPAEYEVVDYLDNQRPQYWGQPMADFEAEVERWKQSIRKYFPTCACVAENGVRQLPEHNIYKCRHCGQTNVRYICAVKHLPTGQFVVFGDVCVAHLGFANFQEFRAAQVRARAAQGNANLRAYRKRLEFLEAHPEFKAVVECWDAILADPVHRANTFIRDVMAKFNTYGELSERQLACLIQSIQRDIDGARQREEAAAQRQAAGVTAPTGRATVEGRILSVKTYDSLYGPQWKMLVALTSGAKVFVTVPSSVLRAVRDPRDLRSKGVRLTATFSPSEDRTFAYGSRPTGELIPVPDEIETATTVELTTGEEE